MTRALHEVVTSCGNVLRGEYKGLDVESDGKTWANIIDYNNNSACECCVINADGDVVSDTGEIVTESWTATDWDQFTSFIKRQS